MTGDTGSTRRGPLWDIGWIPIALGAAALAAALGGRKKGAAALALGAVAGAGAAGALRSAHGAHAKTGAEPEVTRSITIGKSAEELRERWLDPQTLPQIMAGFATVRQAGAGRLHWKLAGPLGSACEWDTETVDGAGDGIGWRSVADGAVTNEGAIRFHPAPAGRGTVLTLRLRLEPPGGALGEWIVRHLGATPLGSIADGALRRFKNLAETGEIPTTARQPAARADTR
ncbi:SRPBCC family protein [Massilia sp. G4R7]|uniref:SRPBCC family protein n=1 Tax=Massilia phyllostachyos TaxID=2898585 RepID=A0ABS8Q5J1_9BURK|nr:SRPBCC family protein [Massilia phyllostachyos]MCD2517019.1 SRPBCC family protein [Massilia phyllostachyos]